MSKKMSLSQIREQERRSHMDLYANTNLYEQGSWLQRPVKTVLDCFPFFQENESLRILDLGCGVGRNCVAIAQHFQDKDCIIDCVDILDFAIDKLRENAEKFQVIPQIHAITASIDDFSILDNHYHWIIAVSALEHVDSLKTFVGKLYEIRDGIQRGGIACLIINSNVTEYSKATGDPLPAQFEVNLPTDELFAILKNIFSGWTVIKSRVQEQCYDIPRGEDISNLHSNVVTFVARK